MHVPVPVVSPLDEVGPEQEALLADSVGLALLVVLHTLSPAERLAFGLHDMFGAVRGDRPDRRPLAGGGEAAGKPRPPPRPGGGAGIRRRPRHAVGARGRVHSRRARGRLRCAGRTARPRRRALRADAGAPPAGMSREVRGAEAVARDALASSPLDLYVSPALINGAAGAVTTRDGKPFYGSVRPCAPHHYSPRRRSAAWGSRSRRPAAGQYRSTGRPSHRGDRFPSSAREPGSRSRHHPCRAPPGQSAGNRQADPRATPRPRDTMAASSGRSFRITGRIPVRLVIASSGKGRSDRDCPSATGRGSHRCS